MKKAVQEALLDMPEYFRFSKGLFSWVGFETEYIPYVAAERFAGTTKWSFAKLIKYAMEGVISFSTMPLQLATFCGALVSVFAIVYGIIIIAHTLLTGIDVPGYATTIVVVLFLGGIQLLVMGILGEYLAKTYIQGKHRVEQKKEDIFDRMMHLHLFRIFEPFYQKNKEMLLYLLFGGLTTIVSIGSYAWVNVGLGINELIANIISWIFAVTFAYVTNKIWVFQSKITGFFDVCREMTKFYGGRLFTLGVEELLLFLFITLLHGNSVLVKFAAQIVILVLNYIISKIFVFRRKKE